jgi:hypothetical protein
VLLGLLGLVALVALLTRLLLFLVLGRGLFAPPRPAGAEGGDGTAQQDTQGLSPGRLVNQGSGYGVEPFGIHELAPSRFGDGGENPRQIVNASFVQTAPLTSARAQPAERAPDWALVH